MKGNHRTFFRTWCPFLLIVLIHTQSNAATTVTPIPVFQVTPPSESNLAVTSQPQLYHDSSLYESMKNSAERHSSVASWKNTNNSLREASVRQKSNNQHSSSESGEQKEYLTRDYNIRIHRDGARESEKLMNSHLRERENNLYDILHNQNPSVAPGHVDPQENDVIEHPKQSFPPVPGAGYIPPASIIEQSAPQILGFQHERDAPRVEYVTADCYSNYMKITVQFNGSFEGLVYSTGYAHDSDCVYVNGSGHSKYEFSIRLNRCGTLGRPEFEPTSNEVPRLFGQDMALYLAKAGVIYRKQSFFAYKCDFLALEKDRNHFMWNTITVQYNPEIEEDWDEHFQVTCEYGYEFRRTVTFPVVGVEKNTASPYLVTLSPPQCYMEVRSGFGPSGSRLTGPVTVGDPLTLMIHMESESTEFDVAVSSCYAHNGAKKRLQLIDANGCILKEQLMSPFRGIRSGGGANHVGLYAYFKAFRFTSSPALYLECDVHMCHGTCPAQRCHWKSLSKRSVDMQIESADNSSLTSENVSLFQALQVLQESPDNSQTGKTTTDELPSSTMCLPVLALTAVSTAFMACLLLSTIICILLCLRMRRMKEAGDMNSLNNYMTSAYLHKQASRKRL